MARQYCQKCRMPITLDPSLDELNPAAYKLLTNSTVPAQSNSRTSSPRQSRPAYSQSRRDDYQVAIQDARAPTFRRAVPSGRYSQHGAGPSKFTNPAMSFVEIGESQVFQAPSHHNSNEKESNTTRRRSSSVTTREITGEVETTNRLFEILSSRSDIDHPICVECTELVMDGLQKRLATATRERDSYVDYLRRANTDVPTEEELQQARQDSEAARNREIAAFTELEKLEGEKIALDKQLADLHEEERKANQAEEAFWRERNAFTTALTAFQSERDALNAKYDHDGRQLQRLQRTNVFNDTFSITHDGYFGTINGLRLGRLSNPVVEWSEINAAWGQTCLLLATVAEKLNFKFKDYALNPMGSTSTVDKYEPSQTTSNDPSHPAKPKTTRLELYSTGDLPLGLNFLHRRFDNAMIAFLECLRQLGDFVEHAPPLPGHGQGQGLKMPYEIRKDKIHDMSIKLSFNQEDNWTKACKYTLTCCKYLLAHASHVDGPGRRR